MEYQKLGETNLNISRIGFGGAAISGFNYGTTDDKESVKAIQKASKLGINFFDTADIYGFGHSEKLLAEGLGEKRKEMIVATKVGLRWNGKEEKSFADLSQSYIFEAVNASLENLQLDSISLYQLHRHDPKVSPKEVMETLALLKEQGIIKYSGASNLSKELLEEYNIYGRLESYQVGYNLLDQQEAEQDIFPLCEKQNIGIIVYSPLAQGMLAGKYTKDSKFEDQDRRNTSKYFTKEIFQKIPELFKRMEEIGNKYTKTIGQVALRWILD